MGHSLNQVQARKGELEKHMPKVFHDSQIG